MSLGIRRHGVQGTYDCGFLLDRFREAWRLPPSGRLLHLLVYVSVYDLMIYTDDDKEIIMTLF